MNLAIALSYYQDHSPGAKFWFAGLWGLKCLVSFVTKQKGAVANSPSFQICLANSLTVPLKPCLNDKKHVHETLLTEECFDSGIKNDIHLSILDADFIFNPKELLIITCLISHPSMRNSKDNIPPVSNLFYSIPILLSELR